MNLPSSIHQKVLLWLCEVAPTPMVRLAAGKSVNATAEWYNRIFTGDVNRWLDRNNELQTSTERLVSMRLVQSGKQAVFVYPFESDHPQEITIEELLAPLTQLTTRYRALAAIEMIKGAELPKLFESLIERCDDTDNQISVCIHPTDAEYKKLLQIVEGALTEGQTKSDKKLLTAGFPIRKLKTPFYTRTNYRGVVFDFINRMTLHLFPEGYNWDGYLTMVVYMPETGIDELLKADIAELKLPEPVEEVTHLETINQPELSEIEVDSFQIAGQPFSDGDTFTIITPELGKVEVQATRQEYAKGSTVILKLGYIKTPLTCLPAQNAKLEFYTNGKGYHTLQLMYVCRCDYSLHNHSLEWFDLTIEGNVITASALGRHFSQPHNHPVTAGYEHLKSAAEPDHQPKPEAKVIPIRIEEPVPIVPLRKVKPVAIPEPQVGKYGQIMLF